MSDSNDDDLIDTAEASRLTGGAVRPGTFEQWRWNGRGGPPWYKFGRAVRYKRADVLRWIESQRTVPAADALSAQFPKKPETKQTPGARNGALPPGPIPIRPHA